jgi:hypothetical protein
VVEVRPDADVIDADALDDVVDVIDQIAHRRARELGARLRVQVWRNTAQVVVDWRHVHDAAIRLDGIQFAIAQRAGGPQRPHVRVARDDGRLRELEHLHHTGRRQL